MVLGAAFVWPSATWTNYFEGKYREAYRVVKAAGGHAYDGPRQAHHFFWHVLWCGLGDFDDKYGYVFTDIGAISYAWPVMQRHHFEAEGFPPVRPDVAQALGTYWDEGGQYPRTPFETPEYIKLVRDKFLGDVLGDPWWFASIIGRRFAGLLSEGTPPSLALGNGLSVPILPLAPGAVWGCLTVVLAAWLLVRRDWFRLKLLAFTLPLVVTALFVHSGGGTVFYNIAHLVAVAILGAGAWEHLVVRRLGFASLVRDLAPSLWVRPAAWLWFAGFGLGGLLALLSFGAVARRVVASGRAEPPRTDGPAVAILPFENQTSDESLAWVGSEVAKLLAARVASPGLRVLDPDTVAWLDPDRVRLGPGNVLAGPRLMALNIVADRSGAQRIVAGRVYQGRGGLVACVAVLTPPVRSSTGLEQCDPIDLTRLFETATRLAGAVVPVLGGVSATSPPASVEGLRLYEEARRAIRRQMWGEAVHLLDQSLREDPRLLPARVLQARVSSQWGLLAPDVLRDMTSAANLREGVEAFRTEVARNPHSSEARVELGRMLIDLGLFDEAVEVLNPLLRTPGVPPEAFGLLATALSSRGDPGRGYQALLEYRRRALYEPTGISIMAAYFLRWGYVEEATRSLDEAEAQRSHQGMSPLTLDDLSRRWSVRALQSDWSAAWRLATQMMDVDDPRAAGAGMLHLARGYLFHGRSRLGGALADEAAFRFSQQHLDPGEAVSVSLEVRLDGDDAAGALALIREAHPAESSQVDRRLAFWETVALARLGRWTEADRARNRLAKDLLDMPGPVGRRLLYHLDGELLLLRGDVSGALSSLSEAARLLPARGFCGDHVPVWYALSRANLAAGRPGQAEVWLRRITGASYERLCWPIPYARSYSLLGRIRAAAGRHDEAAEAFERFLQLWGEGDLATAERDEARRFLLAQAESAVARRE